MEDSTSGILKRLASQPTEDPEFAEELDYGLRLRILDESVEYMATVTRHPSDNRFLMIVSVLSRRYWIIDAMAMQLQLANHEAESIYDLQRDKYIILLESSRWIFLFSSKEETYKRYYQLMNLQRLLRSRRTPDLMEPRFLKLFLRFNQNDDQYIDNNQLTELLVNFDMAYDEDVKKAVAEIQPKQKQGLSKTEFFQLTKALLCKRQLAALFGKHCPQFVVSIKNGKVVESRLKSLMSRQQFQAFLREQQHTCQENVRDEAMRADFEGDRLSFSNFCRYIFSESNSVIDQSKLSVYQDMNQPLTDYYVHSSHNTYLVGNQLTSDSKAFRYLEDLYDGVRCVQLDIHDGLSGPIIKHGFTLTSSITFAAVIDAIAQFSKENPDHLPLILSFENHCSIANQKQMARILKERLDSKIYLVPTNCSNKDPFPSPNSLRGKIVIQGTGLLDKIRPNIVRTKIDKATSRIVRLSTTKQYQQLSEEYPAQFKKKRQNFKEWSRQMYLNKNQKTKVLEQTISEQINSLRVIEDIQLMGYYSIFASRTDWSQSCWEMGNISEANALSHINQNIRFESLLNFCNRCMLRVYPQGTRFGSSNFNPIPMYEVGAQLVSLNTQSEDIYNMVMVGNFMDNGWKRGGYILKPAYMRVADPPDNKRITVAISVISAHGVTNDYDEQCEAQVKMRLVCSRRDEVKNSSVCQLQPMTEQQIVRHTAIYKHSREFRCHLEQPEFAHIYFQLSACGHISIPVRLLRRGYRVVQLLDHRKQFKSSCLLLRVSIFQL